MKPFKPLRKEVRDVDCLVIGAGFFGLYAAVLFKESGKSVTIIDKSLKPFSRASSINQARVHHGYHYPRSKETAESAAHYYNRFISDFNFAINNGCKSLYAIATDDSKTTPSEFVAFCKATKIPASRIDSSLLFKTGVVEALFEVQEKTFDYSKIREYLVDRLGDKSTQRYGVEIDRVQKSGTAYLVWLNNGEILRTKLVINASYSGTNEILRKFGYDFFDLEFQLCEIVICEVTGLRNTAVTVMDGEYFSIVPYGKSNKHILTSVKYTPRFESQGAYPTFGLMRHIGVCPLHQTPSCTVCANLTMTAWDEMKNQAMSFLNSNISLSYDHSQFEIKTFLKGSDVNADRPTIIKKASHCPTFISVLGGKVSTIFELEKIVSNI